MAEIPLVHTQVLPRAAESTPAARHFVQRVLKDWELTAVEDAAGLVVSELVTNAVQHTRTEQVRVTVRRMSERVVRVTVTDRGTRLPQWRSASLLETCGRGLALVDAVSRSWGCTRSRRSKCVWAEITAAEITAGGEL